MIPSPSRGEIWRVLAALKAEGQAIEFVPLDIDLYQAYGRTFDVKNIVEAR